MSSLFVDRKDVEVRLDDGVLVFTQKEQRVASVPLLAVDRIFFRGNIKLDSSLLGKLGEKDIGVVFLSGRHATPSLFYPRTHNDAKRRICQYKAFIDMGFRIQFAKDLISNKFDSDKYCLEKIKEECNLYDQDILKIQTKLNGYKDNIFLVDNLSSILGIEGHAATEYFSIFEKTLPSELNFKGRNRRPPRDPFNAVISFIYTLIFAEACKQIYDVGLDPFIGFFHELDFSRESLACDVMEPLRAYADYAAFVMFKHNVLKVEDFSSSEQGCFLGKSGREKFYKSYEEIAPIFRKKLKEVCTETLRKIMIFCNCNSYSLDFPT